VELLVQIHGFTTDAVELDLGFPFDGITGTHFQAGNYIVTPVMPAHCSLGEGALVAQLDIAYRAVIHFITGPVITDTDQHIEVAVVIQRHPHTQVKIGTGILDLVVTTLTVTAVGADLEDDPGAAGHLVAVVVEDTHLTHVIIATVDSIVVGIELVLVIGADEPHIINRLLGSQCKNRAHNQTGCGSWDQGSTKAHRDFLFSNCLTNYRQNASYRVR